MNRNFKSYKKQSGFTLVEIGIVVAVALLLMGGIIGVPKIIANTKVNDEIGELKAITTNVQKQYANDANYATATINEIIGLKAVPENRIASATTVSNRWGGSMTFTPSTLNTANDSMRMTTTNIPEYECTQIVPQVENGFARVAVGGTDVKAFGGALNKTTLATQCDGGNVSIDFYFTK